MESRSAQQYQQYVLKLVEECNLNPLQEKNTVIFFAQPLVFFHLHGAINIYYSPLMMFLTNSRCRKVKIPGSSFHWRKTAIESTPSYSSISMVITTLTHLVLLHQMEQSVKLHWTQTNAFKGSGGDLSFPFSSLTFCCYYVLARLHQAS